MGLMPLLTSTVGFLNIGLVKPSLMHVRSVDILGRYLWESTAVCHSLESTCCPSNCQTLNRTALI